MSTQPDPPRPEAGTGMVTYEVTAGVREDLCPAYERYMQARHIPDLLATGHFVGASFSRSAPGRYRIRYEARSRAALDRYLAEDGPRLRRHALEAFPEGLQLSREEWSVLASWPAAPDVTGPSSPEQRAPAHLDSPCVHSSGSSGDRVAVTPTGHDHRRRELVARLVEAQGPLDRVRHELSSFGWDCDEPLVTLERKHVAAVLRRYLQRDLTAAEVHAWADAVEAREDIGLAERDAPLLRHTIFILANPALNGALSGDVARDLLAALDAGADAGAGDG